MGKFNKKTRKKCGGDSDIITSPMHFKKYLEKHDRRIYVLREINKDGLQIHAAVFKGWKGNGNKNDEIVFITILGDDDIGPDVVYTWNDFIARPGGEPIKIKYVDDDSLIPIEIYPQQLDGGRKRKYKKLKIIRRKTRKTRKKCGGDSDTITSPKHFKNYLEKHDRRIYLIKQTIDGPPKYFIAAFGKWDGNGNKADKITFIFSEDENAYAAEFAWNDFIEQQPHGLGPKTKLMYLNEGPIPSNEHEIRFALLQDRYSPIDIHPEQHDGGRKRKYKKTKRRKTRKHKRKKRKYRKSHKKRYNI